MSLVKCSDTKSSLIPKGLTPSSTPPRGFGATVGELMRGKGGSSARGPGSGTGASQAAR